MSVLNFWYLGTILLFCGIAGYLIWMQRGHLLRKHWRFVVGYIVLTTPLAYWEAVALRWKAWQYNPEHSLPLNVLGTQFETYIFMALVGGVICSATLIYMQEEEKGILRLRYRSRSNKKKRRKSKLQKPAWSFGVARR